MPRIYIFTIFLALFAVSLVSAQDGMSLRPVIIPSDGAKVSPSLRLDSFSVTSVTADTDQITVDVTYSGGCEKHVFQLFTHPMFFSANDRPIPIFLSHNANGDNCKALVEEKISFTVSDLIAKVKDTNRTGPVEFVLYLPETSVPVKSRLRFD